MFEITQCYPREREKESVKFILKYNPHMSEDTFGKGNASGRGQVCKTPDVATACTWC